MRFVHKAVRTAAAAAMLVAGPALAGDTRAVQAPARAPQAAEAKPAAGPTLYTRLGGVYAIAAVVDDFIDRVMTNPALNANPAVDAAHHRVSAAGFKFQVTALLSQAAGGPQTYVGNDMARAHATLGITEQEWQAFMKDLRATLDKFKVPEREQGEVVALVESTKSSIVVAGGSAAAPGAR